MENNIFQQNSIQNSMLPQQQIQVQQNLPKHFRDQE